VKNHSACTRFLFKIGDMRAAIQRVVNASVEVEGKTVGQIGDGLLVYLSIGRADSGRDAEFMAEKLTELRIFADEAGKMNLSVRDVGGDIMLVSNFTLHGDCRKGRRPGFDAAAEPEKAKMLYEKTAQLINEAGVKVATGVFGAYMQVKSVNDGPVTFLLDSSRLF
jgi:D-tyrosyl-tRNA(Tyr) deacylase